MTNLLATLERKVIKPLKEAVLDAATFEHARRRYKLQVAHIGRLKTFLANHATDTAKEGLSSTQTSIEHAEEELRILVQKYPGLPELCKVEPHYQQVQPRMDYPEWSGL